MKKLLALVAFLALMAGPALAADWNFYGHARVSTFYSTIDNDPFNGGQNTSNYEQHLQGNARIGARVKVDDNLTGRFEYGAVGGNANVRILWGEYDFGGWKLGVGKHYTPLLFAYSNQVYNISGLNDGDTNMSRFGMLYGKRKGMIRFKKGNFQIAAVEQNTTVRTPLPIQKESVLPSIQARYRYEGNEWHLQFAGGFSTFDVEFGGKDYDVTSYLLGVGGRLNIGKAYLKGNVWGGQNVGNMADIMVNGDLTGGSGAGLAVFNGTQVIDNDALAALAVVGYEIRKGLYVEAGYGHVETELDTPGAVEDDACVYYLQSTIFLAPGVFVTPEIGVADFKQTGQPEMKYIGMKWQINF